MTSVQYKRLLKVVALPLLLAGVVLSLTMKPPSDIHVICEYTSDCRIAESKGWFSYEAIEARRGALFEVETSEYGAVRYPSAYVSAASLLIPNVKIVSVFSEPGTSEEIGSPFDQLKGLTGQQISLQMGVKSDSARPINPLGCNHLNLIQSPNLFEASLCGVPDGLVRVQFVLDEEDRQSLQKMKENIEARIRDGRSDLVWHYAIWVPFPLLLFLAISIVFLAIKRAALYVAKG